MKSRRVNGFTIIEVTIAMLLTALAVGITYTVYSIVIKSYNAFSTRNANISTLVSLDHVIRRDFDRADTVFKDSTGVTVKWKDGFARYAFLPDEILRQTERTDTFKVQSQNCVTAYGGLPIEELQPQLEQNRVDELRFTLIFENDTIPCHYVKTYSSADLIQRNPDAIN
jgi:Tfp pilus assembly protein PilE